MKKTTETSVVFFLSVYDGACRSVWVCIVVMACDAIEVCAIVGRA